MRIPASVIMGREGSHFITVITPDRNNLKGVGSLGLLVSVTSIHERPGSSWHTVRKQKERNASCVSPSFRSVPKLMGCWHHIKNEFSSLSYFSLEMSPKVEPEVCLNLPRNGRLSQAGKMNHYRSGRDTLSIFILMTLLALCWENTSHSIKLI